MNLTSHERYTLYKHCLSLGVPEPIAVKIRENSYFSLQYMLKYRTFKSELEDILFCAFNWDESPEGFDFWKNVLDELLTKQKGETK